MKKAIITLTKGYSHPVEYKDLIIRNKFIEENIKEVCDIIVFHEGNIAPEHQIFIKNSTSLSVNFISIPSFEKIEGVEFDSTYGQGFGWGYRHMCNFWFVGFWKYLDAYDLVIRIDDDCLIRSSIDDIFESLENRVCVYGGWAYDDEFVTKGLNDFSISFFGEDRGRKNPSGPYTNLVGFNLKKIRQSPKFFDYVKAVESSNNIFIYRWGDLPLWGEALHYIFNQDDHSAINIKYYHSSHSKFINY